MSSVGEKLRRERTRQHLELAQISAELKISARLLEAIEEEKFERIPGSVFAKSFVRQYARRLGLDEEEIVAEAERIIGSPFAVETLVDVEPASQTPPIHVPRLDASEGLRRKRFPGQSRMTAALMVIVVMLVCSGIYARWQKSQRAAHDLQSKTSESRIAHATAPSVDQSPVVAPPSVAANDTTPAARDTGGKPEAPPSAVHEPQTAPAGSGSTPAGTPATPAGAPASPAGPSATPAPATPAPEDIPSKVAAVRVELTAQEMVWISARADGKVMFSGMLAANETRTVEAKDTLLVRVGNAGAIQATLNGKSLGFLGAKGQPRTVQFTSGGFQTVAASRPSLPL
jgi:cytoskeleton protein RodZ